MSDEQATLGKLTEATERDAIHVAILPVVATCQLWPGQAVNLIQDTNEVEPATGEEKDGIVDPFYHSPIYPGDRFYMCLMPGTVTGMRHHWEHPVIDMTPEMRAMQPFLCPKDFPAKGKAPAESEKWLRDWLSCADAPDFDTVIKAIKGESFEEDWISFRIDDEYFMCYGVDGHSAIPPEFWEHVENYLGSEVDVKPESFSCSC